jgi:DNA-binding transcriptional MerR regulator
MNNHMTLGEVARTLGIPQHRILYLLSTLAVPEPARIAGRRVWTQEQLQELAATLNVLKKGKSHG